MLTRLLVAILALVTLTANAQVTPPDKFFGFRLGSDGKMARWDKIVEYFQTLERESSGKMKVINMGPTTMGNPFLLAIISSPQNLVKLDRLRQVNAAISDPRGKTEAEIRKLVVEGKAVICQSMSLHASEIGGSQMAPELAFDLISRRDEETQRILDNTILLMIPSFNPDGQIMVTDFYRKYAGTEYDGANLPWLYHKYVGHDNNRDAFQTNMVESQYMAKILFREWIPQAYLDHHHMGSYGARIYIPPYAEPMRPGADPLIWREISWFGAHMAYKEEEADLSGVLNAAVYSGWGHFGFHWITPFHNIAGMLTESASARLASPLYIHPDQLEGRTRGLPEYEPQTTFPNPWPGGWWRLRDIVERQKVSAWALMDLAARNRETVLWNAYLKAKRQSDRGAEGKPAAYAIPRNQHDPLTAVKLVNKLLVQGVEVMQATKAITTAEGMTYPEGSWVVSMAQPKSGLIRYLLGRTFYPDNEWTRARDNSPIRPYDMSTDTMFEFMGVRVDPVNEAPKADLTKVAAEIQPAGTIAARATAFQLDGRLNDSYRVVNALVAKGIAVRRVDTPSGSLRPGDFIVPTGSGYEDLAKQTGVSFTALAADPQQGTHPVKALRVGMYQRYRGGNMDEGWTRWILEQFGFPYKSIMDAEIKKGSLNANYDVILLPDDSTAAITGERPEGGAAGGRGGRGGAGGRDDGIPPEYRSGIGADGVTALRSFVEKGGTIVALGGSSTFAIDRFGLSVRNVTANRNTKEFWSPGSTLRVKVDNTKPLGYGMPAEALAVYMAGNPAFEIIPNEHNENYETIVRYVDRDLLQSGWLIGEDVIAKKGAMVSVKMGAGNVVLIGFRTQHRAQTHGTFKLLFNTLLR